MEFWDDISFAEFFERINASPQPLLIRFGQRGELASDLFDAAINMYIANLNLPLRAVALEADDEEYVELMEYFDVPSLPYAFILWRGEVIYEFNDSTTHPQENLKYLFDIIAHTPTLLVGHLCFGFDCVEIHTDMSEAFILLIKNNNETASRELLVSVHPPFSEEERLVLLGFFKTDTQFSALHIWRKS